MERLPLNISMTYFPEPVNGLATLYGQRDIADVSKLRILSWGDNLGLFMWVQCNHKALYKWTREAEGQSQKKIWRCYTASFEDGGRSCKLRSPLHVEKEKKYILLRASRRNSALLAPLFWPSKPHFRLLTSRILRQYMCCLKPPS